MKAENKILVQFVVMFAIVAIVYIYILFAVGVFGTMSTSSAQQQVSSGAQKSGYLSFANFSATIYSSNGMEIGTFGGPGIFININTTKYPIPVVLDNNTLTLPTDLSQEVAYYGIPNTSYYVSPLPLLYGDGMHGPFYVLSFYGKVFGGMGGGKATVYQSVNSWEIYTNANGTLYYVASGFFNESAFEYANLSTIADYNKNATASEAINVSENSTLFPKAFIPYLGAVLNDSTGVQVIKGGQWWYTGHAILEYG